MTVYPVFGMPRHDFTRDCEPIGYAASESEALTLLSAHYDGTGTDAPTAVELNDCDVGRGSLWAYWPLPVG